MTDQELGELDQWIRDELISLWGSLLHEHEWTARNRGYARRDRPWSMACDDLAERIKSATALIGPISWRNIGMTSIIDGWFVWANEKIGIENANLPTAKDVAACREMRSRNREGLRG